MNAHIYNGISKSKPRAVTAFDLQTGKKEKDPIRYGDMMKLHDKMLHTKPEQISEYNPLMDVTLNNKVMNCDNSLRFPYGSGYKAEFKHIDKPLPIIYNRL